MWGPTRSARMTHFGCWPRIFNNTPFLCLKADVVQGFRVWKCTFLPALSPLQLDWKHHQFFFLPLRLILHTCWSTSSNFRIKIMDRLTRASIGALCHFLPSLDQLKEFDPIVVIWWVFSSLALCVKWRWVWTFKDTLQRVWVPGVSISYIVLHIGAVTCIALF